MQRTLHAKNPAVAFLIASVLAGQVSTGLAASVPVPDSTGVTFSDTCHFVVQARRFLLSARRHVEATIEVRNLTGTARFDLDRPFRARLGVDHLRFEIRVEDEHGTVVDRISDTVLDGMQALSMPLRFPAPGAYQVILDEKKIEAGPARVALRPHDRVVMHIVAGTPATGVPIQTVTTASHAASPTGVLDPSVLTATRPPIR